MIAATDMAADSARAAVLRSLGLGTRPLSAGAIRAEAIRAALWSLSSEGESPVYVTRLLNAVGRMLLPWSQPIPADEGEPSTAEKSARVALDELELVGEVSALPGGWWLPAPLRFVHLPALHRWIVLGAVPTARLPANAQTRIEIAELARLLPTGPEVFGLPPRIITLDEWRQAPPEPIEQWARSIIRNTQLQDYPGQPDALEVYAPAYRNRPSQFDRWHQPSGKLANERYLARIKPRHGPTTHLIVELRMGKVAGAGQPAFSQGDIRRLMYGIDAISGNPVSIHVTKSESSYKFKLKSEIPSSEHRLLLALGRLQPDASGAYYPRTWEVAAKHAEQVEIALRKLQVRIVDKGTARHGIAVRSARL